MKKKYFIILLICFSLAFTGCIENSFKKTETVLTKLDSSQKIQWTTVIENKDYSSSQSLPPFNRFIETSDDGFFIAGFFFNRSGGSLRLLKTDSAGALLWEKRIPGQTGEIVTIVQRIDRGYSVFCRDGRVVDFDESGTMGSVSAISEQVTHTPGGGRPVITIRSITRESNGNLIMIGDNYANKFQPVVIARLSENGTVLMEKDYSDANIGGTTSLLQTPDGGLLVGKNIFDRKSGEKKIMIEKTDDNSSVVWNTTLGICNFSVCYNDLLGMHVSATRGYDIVYQSREQTNQSKGNIPVVTVSATLDNGGRVIQQETLGNISGLPPWIYYQSEASSELINMIDERTMNEIFAAKSQGMPAHHFDSLIKTDNGGYALIGTRYYF